MTSIERAAGRPFEIYLRGLSEGWTQKRDIEILQTLYRFRFVRFSDITTLHFPSPGNARHRLLKLYRRRLIDRCKHWAPEGPTEYIYYLDDVGIHYLAAHLRMPVEELNWRKRDTQVKLAYVQQYLACMRLYLGLRRQVALVKFEPEITLKGIGYNFRPDAYAVWVKHPYEYRALFEVDMGTEWEKKIAGKVANYEAYYRANAKSGFVMPYVIFVAETTDRLKKLQQWIDKQNKEKNVQFKFWTFTDLRPKEI